ncbi:titin [Anthonomus grandis grandis]|uniref:titin n=1 Tax=Anthonomus grandis grandis TaxID=2921223 RepID=UPI002165A5B4|nr:titin [Anthonomus grandis grandis]
MSSAICQNFVQNAWKKELCSNCFKSKDEHSPPPKPKIVTLVSSRTVSGIIRDPNKVKAKLNVEFTTELSQFIGYGGEDWLSEEEDEEEEEPNGVNDLEDLDDDLLTDSDEEDHVREIRLETKKNTNYNTVSLAQVVEEKKSYAHLMLGKPVVNSEGKKQTLLVSVTPFGEDNGPPKRYTTYTNKPAKSEKNVKEEKSLLDEISETLEKSNNSILGRRKTPIRDSESNKENVIEEKKSPELINKVERKVNLSRTPALKSKDLEKPVVYQTSTARIELLNTKNSKLPKVEQPSKSEETNDKNNNKTDPNQNEPPKGAQSSPVPPQSREQAGKPDGREDPECPELPALPLTPPPPLENQSSFLHPVTVPTPSPVPPSTLEKPKVPTKPSTVLIRKPAPVVQPAVGQTLSTFAKQPLVKQDSGNEADIKNKRKAPMPPEESGQTVAPLFTRHSPSLTSGDSPVVREMEKRERSERANSCTPKVFLGDNEVPSPAPIPRKSLSISTDNLVCSDEKRKPKGRFSLRKFLRMGSSKDLPRLPNESPCAEDTVDIPRPKPRLVIVHPSELNGAKVEVVAKQDQTDCAERVKASKPPPPPRNYEQWKPQVSTCPPPPKSMEVLSKQLALSRSNSSSSTGTNKSKSETVYANIGEVRSSIVPNKPVRTASMREREAQQQKQQQRRNIYEPVANNNRLKSSENVYEYVRVGSGNRSSSPSSDGSGKNSPKTKTARLNKRSESSIDVSADYFKFGNIPRSMSLTYCGSETESEIYSPYSFYGSETEVTEDDHDWATQNGRTHKLRSRKGRSIVHKNLEDNYGAVVVANHEALAQVLENIQQTVHTQPALRGLKMSQNLRLQDFSLKQGISPTKIGSKSFHQALWGAQHVTLLFSTGITTNTVNLGNFNLNSVTDFSDLIESENDDKKLVQATISVLPWLQVHTIESYGEHLRTKSEQEENWRDGFFVMLQLVNALKVLQAQGIEELPLSLSSFVLTKEVDRESHFRLCILQGTLPSELTTLTSPEEKYGSLCMCASKALTLLQPSSKTANLLQSLLNNERSVSLTQVKSVLEFSLWGPTDVNLGSNLRERELTLQRWLDLQRATVLHGLVCTRVQLTVYEECHLLFLVRSNARMMSDASMLIESNNHNKYGNNSKA